MTTAAGNGTKDTSGKHTERSMAALLSAYLETMGRMAHARAEDMREALTDAEHDLVREAAVMGFIQGRMRPDTDEPVPADTEILTRVLLGADTHPDLYPNLSRLGTQALRSHSMRADGPGERRWGALAAVESPDPSGTP